ARRDDAAKARIDQRVDRGLARRAAGEVRTRDQDAGTAVLLAVEDETRPLVARLVVALVAKQHIVIAERARLAQKARREDAPGVDVRFVERSRNGSERLGPGRFARHRPPSRASMPCEPVEPLLAKRAAPHPARRPRTAP